MPSLRLLCLVVALACCQSAFAQPPSLSWGSLTQDGSCSRCAFRQYYAKLNGIPSGQPWENYCPGTPSTPAEINGYFFLGPAWCTTGWLGIYGWFEVPDSSCNCNWGSSSGDTFQDNGCQDSGFHEYQATLLPFDFYDASTAQFFCENEQAAIKDVYYFKSPSRCTTTGVGIPGPGSRPKYFATGFFELENPDCPNSPYPHYPPNRRRLQSSQHGLSNLYTEGQLQAALPRRALLQKGNYGPFGTNLAVLQALNNVAEVLVALVIFMQQPISNRIPAYPDQQAPTNIVFEDRSSLNGGGTGIYLGAVNNAPGRLPTVTFPNAIVVPVLDPSAQTPYLTGPNNDIIPQASLGGHTPQTAGWLSIPLVDPNRAGSPTVIVTQDLTGCTLVIGVANGQVYFAHVRPLGDTSAPSSNPDTLWQNNRPDLAANLDVQGNFEGVNIDNRAHFIAFGGRAINEGGYGDGAAQIIAFATDTDVYVAVVAGGTGPNGNQVQFTRVMSMSRLAGVAPGSGNPTSSGSGGLALRNVQPANETGWSYVQNTGDVSGKPTIADCNSLLQQINTTGSDNCGTMQVGTCAIVVTDPGGALGCQDVYNLAAYIVATYQDDTTTYTGGEATGTVSLNDGVTVDVNKAVDNSGLLLYVKRKMPFGNPAGSGSCCAGGWTCPGLALGNPSVCSTFVKCVGSVIVPRCNDPNPPPYCSSGASQCQLSCTAWPATC